MLLCRISLLESFHEVEVVVVIVGSINTNECIFLASEIRSQYDFSDDIMELSLTFKNAGRAGFFFDWPVTVYIFDADKKQVYREGLDLDLRELNTNEGIEAVSRIPVTPEMRDEFYIGISITDYDGKDHIRLAIDSEDTKEMIGDVQIIYHYVDPDAVR